MQNIATSKLKNIKNAYILSRKMAEGGVGRF